MIPRMAVQRSQKITAKKEADLVLWMACLNLISLAILTRSRGLRYVHPYLRTSVYTILLEEVRLEYGVLCTYFPI